MNFFDDDIDDDIEEDIVLYHPNIIEDDDDSPETTPTPPDTPPPPIAPHATPILGPMPAPLEFILPLDLIPDTDSDEEVDEEFIGSGYILKLTGGNGTDSESSNDDDSEPGEGGNPRRRIRHPPLLDLNQRLGAIGRHFRYRPYNPQVGRRSRSRSPGRDQPAIAAPEQVNRAVLDVDEAGLPIEWGGRDFAASPERLNIPAPTSVAATTTGDPPVSPERLNLPAPPSVASTTTGNPKDVVTMDGEVIWPDLYMIYETKEETDSENEAETKEGSGIARELNYPNNEAYYKIFEG